MTKKLLITLLILTILGCKTEKPVVIVVEKETQYTLMHDIKVKKSELDVSDKDFAWILMNINRLIDDLTHDEGIIHKVYLDSLGYKTLGIGHLITENDPQWIQNLKVGDPVPEAIIYSYFLKDVSKAIKNAHDIFGVEDWEKLPPAAQEVFINMTFNLGKGGFSKFRNTIKNAKKHDWEKVAEGMSKSLWARQVKSRAKRLIARIEGLGNG